MWKRHASAAAIFVLLSIVMTWPLAPRMTHAVADPSDPYINIWILDWDHYATFHRPLSLFEANIFHPTHDTLALSENLYGVAIFLIPFRLAGASPVTAYNIAMLAGFAFSGYAAWLLGFRLTGSFAAGLAAGVFHAFVPFRFTHLPHVQHVVAGWVPLLLVALLAYIDRPSWRRAILFGAVFLFNGLTNVHWMLFGSLATGLTVLLFVANGLRRWRELLIASAVAGLLLVPFIIPYFRVAKTPGFARSYAETKAYSATWNEWLVSSDKSRVYPSLMDERVNPERRLFPGVLAIIASVCALILARRYPRPVTLGVLWTVLGVTGSLGLNFFVHEFLFNAVPGFRGIRVPARWAEVAYIGMAMLIAVSAAYLARKQRWIAVAIPLFFMVELRAAPIRWYRALDDTPDVYRWLAQNNVHAAAELPIDIALSEYAYAYRATLHHTKLINGASGAVPEPFVRFSALWKSSPIPDEFTTELQRTGTDIVVVHGDMLGPHDLTTRDWLRRELTHGALSFVQRFPAIGASGDWVFRVHRRPLRPDASLAPDLLAFLESKPSFTPWTFGYFDRPPALRGEAFFSGYAFSPYGIRSVDLLFDGGRARVPAVLIPDAKLTAAFPHYGSLTPKPRFIVSIPKRPPGVPVATDIQAEVVDGRGTRKRLQYYWLTWE